MNFLDKETRTKAESQALFCIYSYLFVNAPPNNGDTFSSALAHLRKVQLTEHEKQQLEMIENSVLATPILSLYTVGDYVISDGLNVCTFISPSDEVSIVFRGTGKDEWTDNGEGLSGIPQRNTYFTYDRSGDITSAVTVIDYSTTRQAEALNWFNMTAAMNSWTENTHITVSGHSKGGNKAQYITINSDIIRKCFSFDGQGFSPEAVDYTKNKLGKKFDSRQSKIKSLSAYNDFVSVLGEQMCKSDSIYLFDAPAGAWNPIAYHYPEAILDENGTLREERMQGDISRFIESVSDDLEALPPYLRKHAVLTVTGITERLLGIS